jgi:hypothetical protein
MQRRTFLATATFAALGACTSEWGGVSSLASDRATVLPSPEEDAGVALDDVLARRRSVRTFAERPLQEQAISRLLWAAQGVTASWGGRTAPSAGALYPIEIYVATADALRRYVPAEHRVVELAPEDRDASGSPRRPGDSRQPSTGRRCS